MVFNGMQWYLNGICKGIEENEKVQNAINEMSKRDCLIMGDIIHSGNRYSVLCVRIKSYF